MRRLLLAALPAVAALFAGCPTSSLCEVCEVVGTNYGGGQVTFRMQVGDQQAIELVAHGVDQDLIDDAVQWPHPLSAYPWDVERGQAYLEHFGDALHLDARFPWSPGGIETSCPGVADGETLWLDLTLAQDEPEGPWSGRVDGRLDRHEGQAIPLDGAAVTADTLDHDHAGGVAFPTLELETLAGCYGGEDAVPSSAEVRVDWAFDPAVAGDACGPNPCN